MADDIQTMTAEEAAETVRVEYGPVTHIVFNRPQARNAVTLAMQARLIDLLEACASRDEVKVVVLRGVGPVFCAGADLKEVAKIKKDRALPSDIRLGGLMARYPKPVILVIQGFVGAAAIESLVPNADMIVAVEGTRFSYEILAVIMTLGARAVAWKLGPNLANEFALLARYLTAERLYQAGVVNRVAEDLDGAVAVAQAWAERMAAQPLERLVAQKAALRATFGSRALPFDQWMMLARSAAAAAGAARAEFEARALAGGLKTALASQVRTDGASQTPMGGAP